MVSCGFIRASRERPLPEKGQFALRKGLLGLAAADAGPDRALSRRPLARRGG